MQEIKNSKDYEEAEYKEYKRLMSADEARVSVSKIECDVLSPYAGISTLSDVCTRANNLGIGALVVLPIDIKRCVKFLGEDPQTAIIAAISCPHGCEVTETKVEAIKRAHKDGADEFEVSAPIKLIADGKFHYFRRECKKIKKAAGGRVVRVVLDCKRLTEEQLFEVAEIAVDAGIRCLRLNGAGAALVDKVNKRLQDRCLIKADGAESASSLAMMCATGAHVVACKNCFEVAEFILRKTGENIRN